MILFHLMKILCNKNCSYAHLGIFYDKYYRNCHHTQNYSGKSVGFYVPLLFGGIQVLLKLWKVFVCKKLCNGTDDIKVVIKKLRSLKFTTRPLPALDKNLLFIKRKTL